MSWGLELREKMIVAKRAKFGQRGRDDGSFSTVELNFGPYVETCRLNPHESIYDQLEWRWWWGIYDDGKVC